MADLKDMWVEELPEKWLLKVQLHPADPCHRAHVLQRGPGPHEGFWWWVDGGHHHRVDTLEEAKVAAEQEVLRGLGGLLSSGGNEAVADMGGSVAEPAGAHLVHGEEGGDRPDQRVAGAAARAVGLAVEGIERETSRDLPFDATGEISRRALKATTHTNRRARPMGESRASETLSSTARSMVARLVEGDRVAQEYADRVERLADAVRELVADEEVDPELEAVLVAEVDGAARDLAEAGVEVVRGLKRDLAVAKALQAAAQAEVDAQRDRARRVEQQIARVEDRVLRRACEAAGRGPTHRLDLATARVTICKNPAAVELGEDFDVRLLDEPLTRVKIEPNKEAIKEALKAGVEVPGCQLVQGTRVEVAG